MKRKLRRFIGGVLISLFLIAPAFSGDVDILPPNVSYQLVGDNDGAFAQPDYNPTYGWGIAEITDPAYANYGAAGIEYHYWQDQTYDYWYYSYRIINNGTDETDAYHFGWDSVNNNSKNGIKIYDVIDEFAIILDFYQDGGGYWHGPDDLYVTSNATSTAGGDPWGHQSWSQYNHEMEWSTTRSSGSALGIMPSRWYPQGPGINYTNGDTSTDDTSPYEYFQLVSSWEPDWVEAQVVAGIAVAYSQNPTLGGDGVMGPAIVPEPATLLLLGFGALGMSFYRRKTGCDKN